MKKMEFLHPKLSCPFCGASADTCYPIEITKDAWAVLCTECGANGPLYGQKISSPQIAMAEWDERA
jgi:transcription elongation factor Elf1